MASALIEVDLSPYPDKERIVSTIKYINVFIYKS